jgi:DNA-binding CsgD family transcriptional regulator
MRLLSLSFWQAWWMLSMCTSTILPFGTEAFAPFSPVVVIMALTAFGYLLAIVASRYFSPFIARPGAMVFAALAASLGSLSMWAVINMDGFTVASAYSPDPLFYLWQKLSYLFAAMVCSLGNALLLVMWGELWSTLATARIGRFLCVSYAFAFVIFFAVSAMPDGARGLMLSILPAASVMTLADALKEPRRKVTSINYNIEPSSPTRILLAIAGISLVFGISQQVFVAIVPEPGTVTTSFVVAGICVLALVLRVWFATSQLEPLAFFRPITPVLVAGLVLMAMLPMSLSFLGGGLVIAAIYCMDMLIMMVSADLAFRTRKPVAMIFGTAILTARVGTLVGTLLFQQVFGDAVFAQWGDGTGALGALGALEELGVLAHVLSPQGLLLICVIIAVLIGCLLFNEGDLNKLYRPRSTDVPKVLPTHQRCKNVAELCGLTMREQDVLQLLASGRSIPFISNELSIANGTTKHHVSSIYRKLGVYNRQGLHDVIEQGEVGRGAI